MNRTFSRFLMLAALHTTTLSVGAAETPHASAGAGPEKMPADLETRFALSALPPGLQDAATVYLLDPAKGYVLARKGTNAFSCLVTRTYWYKADFRDDIYDAGCFDTTLAQNNLKVWMDTAELRASGMSADAVRQEIAKRFHDGVYKAPARFAISYMVAPLMRTYLSTTLDDANKDVMTMTYPHVMYSAPNVAPADIGANPRGSPYPTVILQGPHGYVIQPLGQAEKAQVLAANQELLEALCKYRAVLCLQAAH
jgi:hypothetical protein